MCVLAAYVSSSVWFSRRCFVFVVFRFHITCCWFLGSNLIYNKHLFVFFIYFKKLEKTHCPLQPVGGITNSTWHTGVIFHSLTLNITLFQIFFISQDIKLLYKHISLWQTTSVLQRVQCEQITAAYYLLQMFLHAGKMKTRGCFPQAVWVGFLRGLPSWFPMWLSSGVLYQP